MKILFYYEILTLVSMIHIRNLSVNRIGLKVTLKIQPVLEIRKIHLVLI